MLQNKKAGLRQARPAGGLSLTQTETTHSPQTTIIIKNESDAPLQAYFTQKTDGPAVITNGVAAMATIAPRSTASLGASDALGYNKSIDAKHFTLRNASAAAEVIYRVRIE